MEILALVQERLHVHGSAHTEAPQAWAPKGPRKDRKLQWRRQGWITAATGMASNCINALYPITPTVIANGVKWKDIWFKALASPDSLRFGTSCDNLLIAKVKHFQCRLELKRRSNGAGHSAAGRLYLIESLQKRGNKILIYIPNRMGQRKT